jgi:hypothetical protein
MRIAFLLLLLAGLPFVARAQNVGSDAVSWMSGCWLASQGSGEVEENWTKPKGGTMIGISRTVRGDRTTGYEYLRLHVVDGKLMYSALPSGQTMTDFTATIATDSLLRVEKPDHDFPQKIEYAPTGTDRLEARVFGSATDAQPAFILSYSRTSCE